MDSPTTIMSLPVSGAERAALIEAANEKFEDIMERIEPENEVMTRSLWDAGHYLDHHFFKEVEVPIEVSYAAYLIEAILVHYVIDLAVEADKLKRNPPVFT